MIEQIKICGFKDQVQEMRLSGLDLITSRGENGVGKSAVLEALQLGLLGEVPGRARAFEDILKFTNQPQISVQLEAAGPHGKFSFERIFKTEARLGEKRPVFIQGMPMKYEQGHCWIRDEVGAVSICFDPAEFLNLSDEKKIRWVVNHSPEMIHLRFASLEACLLLEILKKAQGVVSVQSLLGGEDMEDFIDGFLMSGNVPEKLRDKALALLSLEGESFYAGVDQALRICDAGWLAGRSTSKNLEFLTSRLKGEILRMKAALNSHALVSPGFKGEARDCDRDAMVLKRNHEDVVRRLRRAYRRLDELTFRERMNRGRDRRIQELRDRLADLCRNTSSGEVDEIKGRLAELVDKRENRNFQIENLVDEIRYLEGSVSRAQGLFQAFWEELSFLENEKRRFAEEGGARDFLKTLPVSIARLEEERREIEKRLMDIAREQGRRQLGQATQSENQRLENKIRIFKTVFDAVGPRGLLGRIARRVSPLLEKEVNDIARWIDPEAKFILDLKDGKFEAGWSLDGKVMPFSTLNSGKFTELSACFMAALVGRLAGEREALGKPTLKALCITGEGLSPRNLTRLLAGLSSLKTRGHLDNVLVTHYHSFENPDILSGFREHVLTGEESRWVSLKPVAA